MLTSNSSTSIICEFRQHHASWIFVFAIISFCTGQQTSDNCPEQFLRTGKSFPLFLFSLERSFYFTYLNRNNSLTIMGNLVCAQKIVLIVEEHTNKLVFMQRLKWHVSSEFLNNFKIARTSWYSFP